MLKPKFCAAGQKKGLIAKRGVVLLVFTFWSTVVMKAMVILTQWTNNQQTRWQ
jgi:hypothetical protein